MTDDIAPPAAERAAIEAFFETRRLQRLATASAGGRLIFALDATASRQPTWDMACGLQAEMFRAVGGLDVQLVFYRDSDCKASRWYSDGHVLGDLMRTIKCITGMTQIGRVLAHARKENTARKISGLVFVGDAMEEIPAELYAVARELGTPAFMFLEGDDEAAAEAFAEIARLTGGAFCRFDEGSAQQLSELLHAVATYAAGGLRALSDLSTNASAVKLLGQLK
jgi:hypothetical protein